MNLAFFLLCTAIWWKSKVAVVHWCLNFDGRFFSLRALVDLSFVTLRPKAKDTRVVVLVFIGKVFSNSLGSNQGDSDETFH